MYVCEYKTYTYNDILLEQMIQEGKLADFFRKFALTATIATSCLAAAAQNPVQASPDQIMDTNAKIEHAIQQKSQKKPLVITAQSSDYQLALNKLASKIKTAEQELGTSLRMVTHQRHYVNDNVHTVVAYLVDASDISTNSVDDAVDYDYLKNKVNIKSSIERKYHTECEVVDGFGKTSQEAYANANVKVKQLQKDGYWMPHFEHTVLSNGTHAYSVFLIKGAN